MATAFDALFMFVDPTHELPAGVCSGPDTAGRCPLVVAGGRVPCAGRDLVLLHGDLSPRWSRSIASIEDECPLTFLCAGGG